MAKDPLRGGVIERPEPDTKAPSSRPIQLQASRVIERPELDTDDSLPVQLYAGRGRNMSTVWHTNVNGHYCIGDLYPRTPRQLLQECLSTVQDLLVNHPGMKVGGV